MISSASSIRGSEMVAVWGCGLVREVEVLEVKEEEEEVVRWRVRLRAVCRYCSTLLASM